MRNTLFRMIISSLVVSMIYGSLFCCWAQQSNTFTLQESLDFAMKNSKSIQIAQEKVTLAEGKVSEAMAGMMPSVSGTGSYTYFGKQPVMTFDAEAFTQMLPSIPGMPQSSEGSGEPLEIEVGAAHNYKAGATLTQPLFTWGKIYNNYKQAQFGLQAAKHGLRSEEQRLAFDVTQAFYGVLLAQEFVKVAERAHAQVGKHVKNAQLLFETGAATNYDVLRAQVQLANIDSQLIRARNGFQLAKEGLKMTLGMKLDESVGVEGEFGYKPKEVELEQLLETARENRPDLKQLGFQKKVGEKLVSLAKAGNKPNLAFVAHYEANDTDKQDLSHVWNLTFALNIPIFDGLATRARVKQAKSGLMQMELGKGLLEDGIDLQVKSAYLALKAAEALLAAQRETVQQATEGLRIANSQYENGIITSVQLTDAQLALTQAEVNRLQALFDHTIGLAKLEKAIGKSLE